MRLEWDCQHPGVRQSRFFKTFRLVLIIWHFGFNRILGQIFLHNVSVQKPRSPIDSGLNSCKRFLCDWYVFEYTQSIKASHKFCGAKAPPRKLTAKREGRRSLKVGWLAWHCSRLRRSFQVDKPLCRPLNIRQANPTYSLPLPDGERSKFLKFHSFHFRHRRKEREIERERERERERESTILRECMCICIAAEL